MLGSALFLFFDTRTVPIILWDESRTVANALEMRSSGFSLITTYDFRPDLWNTKPPLLIWLMTASMSLFGPTEFAVRLPSAIAALATLLCLILFVRRITGSIVTGLLAAALLMLSPGFFGEHGARTADYDAALLFFVTAALQLLFFAIHRARPSLGLIVSAGALAAFAGLTKTVSGFIPFVGIVLYLLATRRSTRITAHWPVYVLAGVLALAPLLLFYALREIAVPGYFPAAMHNDLGGRFAQALTARVTGPSYYVSELLLGWFVAGPLLLLAPWTLRGSNGRNKVLLLWAICISIGILGIYSVSSTRLIHYVLPAFPWLAIVGALTARFAVEHFVVRPWRARDRSMAAIVSLALLMLTVQMSSKALHWRYEGFRDRQFTPQATYGELFGRLAERGILQVTVVDPGIRVSVLSQYAPLVHVQKLIWRERGFMVTRVIEIPETFDEPLVSCEPRAAAVWSAPGVERLGRCVVLFPAKARLDERASRQWRPDPIVNEIEVTRDQKPEGSGSSL
jgi:4-amino-4-deoxy-L-arabinose transferase-like glycosyltransferase